MAGSAGAVRAGGAYVEIFANDSKFQQAMTRVANKMKAIGSTLSKGGTSAVIGGAAMAAPMIAAVRSAAAFEDTMLGLRAATNLTGTQLDAARAKVLALSAEMGTTPSKVGAAFQSLAKAGVGFDDLMNGALETAVQFSKMAPELGIDQISEQMNKAANSFNVPFKEVADTISAAADTTETSVAGIFAAFGDVAPYAAQLKLSISDTTMAIAALSKGMNVEEAGTAFKVFLQRLINPTQEAQESLASLGLSMRSFRDQATGQILPPDQIAAVFAKATAGKDPMQTQQASANIFGDRGVKAISTFAAVGADGMARLKTEMGQSKSVAEKYDIVMSGLSGMIESLQGGVDRLAISFSTSLGPATKATQQLFSAMLQAVGGLFERFPVLSKVLLNSSLVLLGVGAAAILAGKGFGIMGTALGLLPTLLKAVSAAMALLAANPAILLMGTIAAAIGAAVVAARQLSPEFKKASDSWLKMSGLMEAPQGNGGPADASSVKIQQMLSDAEMQANQQLAAIKNQEDIAAKQGVVDAGEAAKKAEQDRQQRMDRGKSITESVRTPQEQLADTYAELKALRDEGAITADVFGRAFRQAAESAASDIASTENDTAATTAAFGASVGTFGSGEGLGIGAELGALEDPAKQTAANTAAAAEALMEMARNGGLPRVSAPDSGATTVAASPMGSGAAANAAAISGVADQSIAARSGTAAASETSQLSAAFSKMGEAIVTAVKDTTAAVKAGNETLKSIDGKLSGVKSGGLSFV